MKAIFGLGNPGQQYKNNRHNIGYNVIAALGEKHHLKLKRNIWLSAFSGTIEIENEKVIIVKPTTFMNNSGICINKILNKFKIKLENSLVVYDDIELPFGKIRLREKGSSGGHRGLQSVITILKAENINRLRFGIGKPQNGEELTKYVLSDFSTYEKTLLNEKIAHAVSACYDWVILGTKYVMQKYN